MKPLKIFTHPHPILNKVCNPIKKIEDKHKELALRMHVLMKKCNGFGLAAPQAGRDIRLFVMDTTEIGGVKRTIINPEIIETSLEKQELAEGCLSFPKLTLNISRPITIKIKYLELDGNEKIEEFKGIDAKVVHHEMDHLDGILFTSKKA